MHVVPVKNQYFTHSEVKLLSETALTPAVQKKFEQLRHLIGNTPMLELFYSYKGKPRSLYVKCEQYNFTGSMKDRMALYVLHQAYREGRIRPGDRIVEATSGSTGIAFSAIGKALGHPVTIIMPIGVSQERIDITRSLGADVVLISKEEGGFMGAIQRSEEMAACDPHV